MTAEPRFLQIHTLHGYTAALLNRDDAGLAKRLPFGGVVRTRVSSQCLKRHWRIADDKAFALSTLKVPMAIRSRETLGEIRKRLFEDDKVGPELAQIAVEALREGGLLDKAGSKRRGDEALRTGQAVLLGTAEINYLVERCAALAKAHSDEDGLRQAIADWLKTEKKSKNLAALQHGSGLESALFGRMVTSDVLTSRDASIYVSHAFTVHEAQVENDYFTVVDDLTREAGELSSAGIFDTELASGLYYGYVVVDVRQLVANLEGIAIDKCFAEDTPAERRELAAKVVRNLLHLIATVSPGAKKGSTAPFGWASLMVVEVGDLQPRSGADAFREALAHHDPAGSLRSRAAERLIGELKALDKAYGAELNRCIMSLDNVTLAGAQAKSLPKLADWVAGLLKQGHC